MSTNEEQWVLGPVDRPRTGGMRRILACLDRSATSEGCLPLAAAFADTFGSTLELVHVLETGACPLETPAPDAVGWLIARSEAEEYLVGVAARLTSRGLRARTALLEGHAAEQILCFADREEVDLIVLSTHGERGPTEWSLGGTTEKVLARTRSSVLVVPTGSHPWRTDGEARLSRFLVPLDGSPLAEGVLPPLEWLARERGATLILLHVASPPELFPSPTPSGEDAGLSGRLVARNERDAHRYLGRVAQRLRREGFHVEELVERGDPRTVVPRLAAGANVDLVAITSHGRTGNRCRCYGDTAAHLLHHAPAPVLMLQNLPQQASEFARAVRHRREFAPLRGGTPFEPR